MNIEHTRAAVLARFIGDPRVLVNGSDAKLGTADLGVLAALLHHHGMVDTDTVRELASVPPRTPAALQSSVFRLRRALGTDAIISSRSRLGVDTAVVRSDLQAVRDCWQLLVEGGEPAADLRDDLLTWCDGEVFSAMRDHPGWHSIRAEWTERLDVCHRWLIAQLLNDGRHDEAVVQARRLVARSPQHARDWAHLTADRRDAPAADRRLAMLDVGAPRGRHREFSDAISQLNSAEQTTVVVSGQSGIGKSFLLRAIADRARQAGATTIALQGYPDRPMSASDALRELLQHIAPDVSTDGDVYYLHGTAVAHATAAPTPTLLTIDDAQWFEPDALSWLGQFAAQLPRWVRVLVGSRAEEWVTATLQHSSVVHQIHLSLFDRTAIQQLLEDSGVGQLGAAADVELASGGLPLFVAAHIDARQDQVGEQQSLRQLLYRRVAALDPVTRRIIHAASLTPRGVPERTITSLAGASPSEQLAVLSDVLASRLARFERGRITLIHEVVRDGVAEAIEPHEKAAVATLLAADLAQAETTADRFDRAHYLLLTDRADRLEAAEDVLLQALAQLDWFDDAGREGVARQAVALMERHGAGPSDVVGLAAEVASSRFMINRSEWLTTMRALHRAAADAGPHTVVRMLYEMSRNRLALLHRDAEEFRQIALPLVDEPTLTVRERAIVQSVIAFHEVARHSREVGAELIGEALATARALGDSELEWWMLRGLLMPESSCREFDEEAQVLIGMATERGNLQVLFEAKLYRISRRLRAREITYRDPAFLELQAIAEGGRSMWLQALWMMLDWLRRRGMGDLVGAQAVLDIFHQMGADSFVVGEMARLRQAIADAPDVVEMQLSDLARDLDMWGTDAPIDLLLHDAAAMLTAGDHEGARRLLATISQAVGDGRPSCTSEERLPTLTAMVVRLGDRELAAQLLELQLPMAGSDLVVLPGGDYGPVEHYLAHLARIAGDPRQAHFEQVTADRVAAHRQPVTGSTVTGEAIIG